MVMRFKRSWDFDQGNKQLDLNSLTQDDQVLEALQAGLSATFVAWAPSPNGDNDTAAIQALLDAAAAAGGGEVRLKPAPPSAPYKVSVLVIDSAVTLRGAGVRATRIQQLPGTNADCVQSKDFATLFGTNKWLVSAGVKHGMEVHSLTIDGNRANNASGRGLALYAKGFVVDNVKIMNTAGDGYYSETGTTGGQETADDMPEASVTRVWVHKAGGVGFRYRGPHDGYVDQIYVSQSDGDCARFEYAAGIYLGAADVGFMHVYASQTGRGVLISAQLHADHIISESNYTKSVEFAAGSGGTRIDQLSAFGNWLQYMSKAPFAPQANAHVHLTAGASDVQIATLRVEAGNGGTGLLVEGSSAHINGKVLGLASPGMGVGLDGSQFTGEVEVRGFSAAGGIGWKEGLTTGRTLGDYTAIVTDCATCVTFGFQGVRNIRRFRISTLASQVAHDGSAYAGTQNVTLFLTSGAGGGAVNLWDIGVDIHRSGSRILTTRKMGWTAPTGVRSRAAFDPSTVTLPTLAQVVAALYDDLASASGHGLIN